GMVSIPYGEAEDQHQEAGFGQTLPTAMHRIAGSQLPTPGPQFEIGCQEVSPLYQVPSLSETWMSGNAAYVHPPYVLPEPTLLWEALKEMKANLIKFLLFKYLAKELTSQAEILKKVLRDNQEHFPVVFSQASHCLELVCGVEVKEVDPREHIYIMVPNLGLTCDVMLSSGQSMPKAGLLVLILSLIMQNGDRAPEEKVWGALSRLGVCVGSVHCVFGEPRTLLTHVWVQEGYLEYRQVPYSYPARYEFLWGPRAYAETSKQEVMAFLLRIKERASRAFPPLSAEAAREEDEAA
ncbi:unnamed protein product, partial [Rangifer tarandus platyrhynchus]